MSLFPIPCYTSTITYRNIGRVIFYSLTKFDGTRARLLTPAHTQQIAGRAGRYGKVYSKGFVTT